MRLLTLFSMTNYLLVSWQETDFGPAVVVSLWKLAFSLVYHYNVIVLMQEIREKPLSSCSEPWPYLHLVTAGYSHHTFTSIFVVFLYNKKPRSPQLWLWACLWLPLWVRDLSNLSFLLLSCRLINFPLPWLSWRYRRKYAETASLPFHFLTKEAVADTDFSITSIISLLLSDSDFTHSYSQWDINSNSSTSIPITSFSSLLSFSFFFLYLNESANIYLSENQKTKPK